MSFGKFMKNCYNTTGRPELAKETKCSSYQSTQTHMHIFIYVYMFGICTANKVAIVDMNTVQSSTEQNSAQKYHAMKIFTMIWKTVQNGSIRQTGIHLDVLFDNWKG